MNRFTLILFSMAAITSCAVNNSVTSSNPGGRDYGSPQVKQVSLNETTFKIDAQSEDKAYGYSASKPVMVGGKLSGTGENEKKFLNALSGPNGESLKYSKIESCCPFKTKNGLFEDSGTLDKYSITYEGLQKPLVLYINTFDSDTLKVPEGLKLKN
jgi:hypothetical protein